MSWNYRVVRHSYGKREWYAIHEAWYNERREICSITERAIAPVGDSISSLRKDLELMLATLRLAPIKYDRKLAKAPWDRVAKKIRAKGRR